MNDMEKPEEGLIIGIDITKYNIQISCLPWNDTQAETISTQMGTDRYEIPLCLFRYDETGNWSYGEKARTCRDNEDGVYVEDLWEGMLTNRELILEHETVSYTKLMAIFLDKALRLVSRCGYTGPTACVVFTTEDMNVRKIRGLQAMAKDVEALAVPCYYMDYEESFGSYAANGTKDLWNHDVFLFHYTDGNVTTYQMRVNQKTLPFRMLTGKLDREQQGYSGEELENSQAAAQEMDQRFEMMIEELFAGKIVSAVYLIGEGFLSGWMNDSLRTLCRGRRVFQGNNLFSKGACYAGRHYLGWQKRGWEYTGSQMLLCDVRIPLMKPDGTEGYITAAGSQELWYQAGCTTECMLDCSQDAASEAGTGRIEVEISGMSEEGAYTRREIVELTNLPKRPAKAFRVRITTAFTDSHTAKVTVKDMGLGEFCPSTEQTWEKCFSLDAKAGSEKGGEQG